MRIENTTRFDNGLIEYLLQQAGCDTSAAFTLVVEPLSVELAQQSGEGTRGLMFEIDGTYYVQVDNGAGLDILAHELKHVEQYQAGLVEWIRADKAVSEYESQWHEIEAWEFGNKWK